MFVPENRFPLFQDRVSQIMARIRTVERLVAEREVGDNVAFDRGLQQWPLEPGWIAQMATLDSAVFDPHRGEYIAAKTFCKAQSLAAAEAECRCDRAILQARQKLFDQRDALLDFADADPDTSIDIAFRKDWYGELKFVIGRIGKRLARVEIAAAGAADIAWGGKRRRIVGANDAGP